VFKYYLDFSFSKINSMINSRKSAEIGNTLALAQHMTSKTLQICKKPDIFEFVLKKSPDGKVIFTVFSYSLKVPPQ
jgi:hypothetical protein